MAICSLGKHRDVDIEKTAAEDVLRIKFQDRITLRVSCERFCNGSEHPDKIGAAIVIASPIFNLFNSNSIFLSLIKSFN